MKLSIDLNYLRINNIITVLVLSSLKDIMHTAVVVLHYN